MGVMVTTAPIRLTDRPEWRALQEHHARMLGTTPIDEPTTGGDLPTGVGEGR